MNAIAPKRNYLTKSLFKIAEECPRKLYYTKHKEFASLRENDDFLQALAEGGYQVGELAKHYFPGGHNITAAGHDEAVERTNELLKKDHVIIFEAAIRFQNLFIRVDILEKRKDHLNLFEVKAKSFDEDDDNIFLTKGGYITSKWRPYLLDVAFQHYVLQLSFPNSRIDSHLMLADKSKRATVNGLNQKFQLVKLSNGRKKIKVIGDTSTVALGTPILTAIHVNREVEMIHLGKESKIPPEKSFAERVKMYATALEQDQILNAEIGVQCGKCEFKTKEPNKLSGFETCWKAQTRLLDDDFQEPMVFDLWNYRRKEQCIRQGVFHLKEMEKEHIGDIIPKENGRLSSKERQWLQVEKVKQQDNSIYVDRDGLRSELKSHNYPLHFIDFETSMVAIPFHAGRRPYEQIAFQFSHHIMESDGTVRHHNQFISGEQGAFPNFDFLRALKADLEADQGTIFRFAAHENTVLNQIKDQLLHKTIHEVPDQELLIEFIDHITYHKDEKRIGVRSMIDMCQIIKDYIFDPYTNGSNSIKAVLPAVIKRSSFIQRRYSKPIYGKGCEIPSLNFHSPQTWIQRNENGEIKSPYELLPPLFGEVSEEETEWFMDNQNIKDGGAAMLAYARIQFTGMSETERRQVIEGLLRYCELDTLAMVIIYEYWLNELLLV